MRFIVVILILLLGSPLAPQAQDIIKVDGTVLDHKKAPLTQASITVQETGDKFYTDEKGYYAIEFLRHERDSVHLLFSYVGKLPDRRHIALDRQQHLGATVLVDRTLDIEAVDVIGQFSGQSNSSIVMDRDLIERYPSLSLYDLLNLLPNRKITPPSVQELQNITLRGAFAGTTGSTRNPYEMGNSFGVGIIIDDIAMSNNGNMQGRNPGFTQGMAGANNTVRIRDYRLSGEAYEQDLNYSGESSYGGIDLRQIPTENVESIEVISGVAPVRYGDISDGAVIVNRQAGVTPTFFRVQLRNTATSYGLSKGFMLSPKLGNMNIDVGYVNSYADNRDKLKQYARMNGSLMWSTQFGQDRRWRQTSSVTYNKILDRVNTDPDDPAEPTARFGNWNFNASTRWSYRPNGKLVKNIGLNVGVQTSHQVTYATRLYNDAFVLYTRAEETGIHEGIYGNGQYLSVDHVDGRPLSLNARLETNLQTSFFGISHRVNAGLTYDFTANNGKGRLSDPSIPLKGIGNNTDRYYDFSLAVPSHTVGIYLEDRFEVLLAGKPLTSSVGVRYDLMNGHQSVSPRANVRYALGKDYSVGLAYGLSFKAPSLAHLYPGPSFYEAVLLNAYNGKVAESIGLIYVDRFDPDHSQLKAQMSQTIELSSQITKKDHRLSVNAYYKKANRGINTLTVAGSVTLPEYAATPVPGQKPDVNIIDEKRYALDRRQLTNQLYSDNIGVELMYQSPRVDFLMTRFSAAGGITRSITSTTNEQRLAFNAGGVDPNDVVLGFYKAPYTANYYSQARIGSATHLPKLKLIVELTADCNMVNYSKFSSADYRPVGLMRRDVVYERIDAYDPNNPEHKMLYDERVKDLNLDEDRIRNNYIIPNFHLSLAKEINKHMRISFNAFNFLNYQPRIYNPAIGRVILTNPPVSYGGQLTYKF